MESLHVALVLVAVGIALLPYLRRRRLIGQHSPPGPRGLPVLGNLFQLQGDIWMQSTKWKQQYGDLVFLNVVGQPILVLNSLRVAVDLLDRRSDIYSDRPKNIVTRDMLCGGRNMVLMDYHARYKSLRRVMNAGLTKPASLNYHAFRSREAISLVRAFLQHPNDWKMHVDNSLIHLTLSILYGLPETPEEREYAMIKVKEFVDLLSYAGQPGNYLVQYFQWMKYIPRGIARWKDELMACYEGTSTFFQLMYKNGWSGHFTDTTSYQNMSKTIHEEQDRHGLDDIDASWLMGTLYFAASETTATQLSWLIIAMTKYPDVQQKAQRELDHVIGRNRIPDASDIENLPYLQAIVKELFRWATGAPIGVPHCAAQDDWYNGYFIPKGTMVIANIWAMHIDKEVYGNDAEEFDPSRFLDKEGRISIPSNLVNDTKSDGHSGFGFGKRACPGRNVAEDSLHMFALYILWALKIEPKRTEDGKPIVISPSDYHSTGVVLHPAPYRCNFSLRFPDVEVMLDSAQ
ncbi:cytochrome P450 [Abortiporus biennis]|nr:cytochrome P450 [Abortiporus biennis]